MTIISFEPQPHQLKFVQGDSVPPITFALNDENGDPIDTDLYTVTSFMRPPGGDAGGDDDVPITASASAGVLSVSLTRAQSALVQPESQWCVRLTSNDLTLQHTVILGRATVTIF